MSRSVAGAHPPGEDPLAIALFLPQFHPTPENNEWWGEGFTEWTNVVAGRPRFPGHYQPHRPRDLGYYDLRLPETRAAQAALASSAGISAFCYYHYWFNGRRLLDRPFADIMTSGAPHFPFLLCWANENWTRSWDGRNRDILISQEYSEADDARHIEHLLPVFEDARYLKNEGRPIFLVYHAAAMPDPLGTANRWRAAARAHGFPELYLCRVDRFADDRAVDPRTQGFDAAVDFQPNGATLPPQHLCLRIVGQLAQRVGLKWRPPVSVFDYRRTAELLAETSAVWRRHPCVFPGWDNSARRRSGGATVFHKSSPSAYGAWLAKAARHEAEQPGPKLIFINAWNEWAEGAHLEPDERYGHAFLDATAHALEVARSS